MWLCYNSSKHRFSLFLCCFFSALLILRLCFIWLLKHFRKVCMLEISIIIIIIIAVKFFLAYEAGGLESFILNSIKPLGAAFAWVYRSRRVTGREPNWGNLGVERSETSKRSDSNVDEYEAGEKIKQFPSCRVEPWQVKPHACACVFTLIPYKQKWAQRKPSVPNLK